MVALPEDDVLRRDDVLVVPLDEDDDDRVRESGVCDAFTVDVVGDDDLLGEVLVVAGTVFPLGQAGQRHEFVDRGRGRRRPRYRQDAQVLHGRRLRRVVHQGDERVDAERGARRLAREDVRRVVAGRGDDHGRAGRAGVVQHVGVPFPWTTE